MTQRNFAASLISIRTPPETIVETDWLALASNPESLGVGSGQRRIVKLACGHAALTAAFTRIVCPRCSEMLRRSIDGDDADYESYRAGTTPDRMSWLKDPCRILNEPHDLAGNPSR